MIKGGGVDLICNIHLSRKWDLYSRYKINHSASARGRIEKEEINSRMISKLRLRVPNYFAWIQIMKLDICT